MVVVAVVLPLRSRAVDVLHLKDGKMVRGKIEMMTHKVVSIRSSVDLGRGKRGEVKRAITLKAIEHIEFGFEKNERQLLQQGTRASRAALRKLWDQKVGYLGQPRSNTGVVGLVLAQVLLQTDSSYHWNDAMALYNLIEKKSWNEDDRRDARTGRMHGLVVQGKLDEAEKLANGEIGRDKDEEAVIEAHLLLGEVGLLKLKELQKEHPKWQDDDEVRPQSYLIYHQTLDHYLDAHLLHGTWEEPAVRGLMGAVAVYRFAGKKDRVRECLEDVVQIYPDSLLVEEAIEQLKYFYDDQEYITK